MEQEQARGECLAKRATRPTGPHRVRGCTAAAYRFPRRVKACADRRREAPA